MNQSSPSTESRSTEITFALAALCGISNESPLDTGLHARFIHRVIAYAVRAALREQPHFEETLIASVLWSYPDFRVCYDDVRYVLQRLLSRGIVQYTDGEYMLAN